MSRAQTVLVTGAFGLVGSETVRQLMVEGPHVVATDLDVPANRKAADNMPSTEVRWADLTDPDAVSTLLRAISPAEDFRSVVDVCLDGAFLVIKHAAPHLHDGGALVSISSGNQPAP